MIINADLWVWVVMVLIVKKSIIILSFVTLYHILIINTGMHIYKYIYNNNYNII